MLFICSVYDEATLRHVWRVGPVPCALPPTKKQPLLNSLGDTAVDFDIAPPRLISQTENIQDVSTTFSGVSNCITARVGFL